LDRTTTGDGIIAALQIMAEMQDSGKSLHELKSGMHKYPQVLVNVKTNKKIDPDQDEVIQKSVKAAEKKLGDNGRVLLRASGTEPLIRVMVEGQQEDLVRNYAHQIADDVKKVMGA
jgi:phosphoglucosamine mutase